MEQEKRGGRGRDTNKQKWELSLNKTGPGPLATADRDGWESRGSEPRALEDTGRGGQGEQGEAERRPQGGRADREQVACASVSTQRAFQAREREARPQGGGREKIQPC